MWLLLSLASVTLAIVVAYLLKDLLSPGLQLPILIKVLLLLASLSLATYLSFKYMNWLEGHFLAKTNKFNLIIMLGHLMTLFSLMTAPPWLVLVLIHSFLDH